MPPTLLATAWAIITGIETRSAPLTPELINMRTIGTVKISTKPAPKIVLVDSDTAALIFCRFHAVQEVSHDDHGQNDTARQIERLDTTADTRLAKNIGPAQINTE